jgi:SAM-dependent methyltransferase
MPDAKPPGFESIWRDRFVDFALNNDDEAGIAGWSRSGLAARTRRFTELWRRSVPGERWLDAGCGAGTYSRSLQKAAADVWAVDYSWPAIAKGRSRALANIPAIVADVRRLPFAPASFDGVICFGVMQALAEPTTALRELARVARPGAALWVDSLNGSFVPHAAGRAWRSLRGRPPHLRYESAARLPKLIVEAGFDDVEIHWLPLVPEDLAVVQRWFERPGSRAMLARLPRLAQFLSHSFILRAVRRTA